MCVTYKLGTLTRSKIARSDGGIQATAKKIGNTYREARQTTKPSTLLIYSQPSVRLSHLTC